MHCAHFRLPRIYRTKRATIQVANYRFRLSQDDFGLWIDKLKQDVGFDKEAVIAEIRRRLDI